MEPNGWYSETGKYDDLQQAINLVKSHLDVLSKGQIGWQAYRATTWVQGEMSFPSGPVPFRLREANNRTVPSIAMDTSLLPTLPAQSVTKIKEFVSKLDPIFVLQIQGRIGLTDEGVTLITCAFHDELFPGDGCGYTLSKVNRMYILNAELGMKAMDCSIQLHRNEISLGRALSSFWLHYQWTLTKHSIPHFQLTR
jgi:hypothetical protein